jgi:hypothetical protein
MSRGNYMNREDRDKIVEELREKYPIEKEVSFNEFNISEKLQENMTLKIKYQELYDKENFLYKELQNKYDILVGQRYDFYKFESDRNLTKTEIEQYYLPKDKKIRQLKEILKKQEIKVKFFEICMRSIDNLYWRIKAYLDNEKL